jgi:uncharacterized membrane protein
LRKTTSQNSTLPPIIYFDKDIKMNSGKLAKRLLATAALSTIIIPLGVDAVLLSKGHMNNPAWLPHAKLHCAMSFFAAISLGGAALAILKARPASDRFLMGLAAFLGSAFWVGLIASGFWPGTSYGFQNDPVLGNTPEPQLMGITIHMNVVLSVITIAIAIVGYGFARQVRSVDAYREAVRH